MRWNLINLLVRALEAMRTWCAITALLSIGSIQAQTLTVAKQTNLQQLAASITGPGVVISNPVMTCDTTAYGTFSYSGAALGVEQGVILTSGKRTYALGPNNIGNKSFQISSPGDAELNIVTGRTTFDACKFEFDIIPAGDSLRFDFVFGSEEYNEWVGSQFNDVFGFFISGPGIVGDPGIGTDHNIALVPGTNTAVTINNINNGSNQTYYHDNAGGAETQYDGYTVGLSARSLVTACQTYHLKLVVADASDKKLDSGVLINTVSSNPVTMSNFTANGTPDMVEGCNPGTVRFTRPSPKPTPLTLSYYLTGTATNGTDYTAIAPINPLLPKSITIPANQTFVDQVVNPLADGITEPTEYLRFILGNPFCPAVPLDTLIFDIVDTLIATVSPGGTICLGNSWPFTITGGASYSWTPTTGLSCSNCANPIASPATTTTYTVTITDGTCSRTASRQVKVSNMVLNAVLTNPLCNGNANGAINLTVTGGHAPITYAWTGPGGFTATSQDITNLAPGTYTVVVTDVACSKSQSWNLIAPAVLSVSISPNILAFGQNISCHGGNDGSITSTITGGTGPYTISWSGPGGFTSSSANVSNLIAGTYTINVTDAHGCTASASTTLVEAAQLAASISATTNVNCFGDGQGSATVTGSGGVPPYSYSWNSAPVQTSSTASAIPAGSYIATITDGYNCTATANATITGPTAVLSTSLTSHTNVLCHGNSTGAASISISGGTSPYSTSWNTVPAQNGTSATNLPAGTWTATVTDAHGCTTTRTVTITEPASSLSASIFSQTNVLCFGNSTGNVTVNASGGTGPYTYQWNTAPIQNTASANNLVVGNYTCTVRDVDLCSVVVNVTITQPAAAITANVTAQTNVLCYGASTGSATVTASGGTAPLAYSWNSSPVQATATMTGVPAGSYTCTITDANGCSVTRNTTITQPAFALQASNMSHVNETCFGSLAGSATISVSGGSGSYSISWNTVPVQAGLTATGLAAGTYTATVTDNNGCASTASVNVTISGPSAAMGMTFTTNDPLCASDNTGKIDISVSGGVGGYTYAWTGPGGFTSTNQDFPSGGLIAGTYNVTVTDGNGCVITQSFTLVNPSTLAVSGVIANVNCNGQNNGSISITASGATPPYVYSWTGPSGFNTTVEDLTNLITGTYTLWLRDANGCQLFQSWTVTQPAILSASIASQTNISCTGGTAGSATVTVTGGTTSYSYSWNSIPVQTAATATNLAAGTYTCTVTDAHGCNTSVSVTITQPGSALSASIASQTNVLCFGNSTGNATTFVSGGVGPYSYSWNSAPVQSAATAINLAAGNYTCNVSDANGCTASASVMIVQPASAISASLTSQSNVLCFGNSTGSATVTATGGTAPLAYSWNTSPVQNTATATGLVAGTYTCTITDANGCSTALNATITQPATAISASITSQTNVLCVGNSTGSATVTASGGIAPLSYSWNSSPVQTTATATGLVAGNYTCTITDANGCSTTASATITQPASALSASISGSTNVLCFGNSTGSASVTAIGGTGTITYSWNTAPVQTTATATGLVAGSYTCTVKDANNCTVVLSVSITQPASAISASITSQTNVFCHGNNTGSATVTANGGTAPLSYSWNPPYGGQNTATATGLPAGTFTCTITDANGCSLTRNATITQPAASLSASISSQTNVLCFGNSTGNASVLVSGGTGSPMFSWNTSPVQTASIATNLPAGTWTCTITDANGCSTTASATITQPASALSASISGSTNVLCFGNNTGSATAIASGGNGTITYSWNTVPVQTTATATGLVAGTYTCNVKDANNCTVVLNVTITQPASAISASITSQTNVLCNGNATGSATVTASGGTGVISYSWNTSPVQTTAIATGLTAGTYTCTITDANGCSTTRSVTITQPASSISASITSQTNVLCFGNSTGSATVTASGGTGVLAYSWTTSPVQTTATATGLVAGNYTCTITDANGCSTTASTTITQPTSVLTASISGSTSVLCFGNSTGTATAIAAGATGTITYSWNTAPVQTTATATGLVAGTYTCTVKDANNCTVVLNVTITQPASAISASITSQTNVLCNGNPTGSATVTASGGTGVISYSWNTSPVQTTATATGLTAGTYTCTITDANGCSLTRSATITQPAAAVAISGIVVPATCGGAATGAVNATVTGGVGPYGYSWTGPGAFTASTEDITALTSGVYTLTATDANGCSVTTSFNVGQPGLFTVSGVTSSYIGGWNVSCANGTNGSIDMTVSGGTLPYTHAWTGPSGYTSSALDISGLQAGSYTYVLTDANGCSTSASFTLTQPTPVVFISNSTQSITCNGDANAAVSVTGSGGTAPIAYSWTGPGAFSSSSSSISGLQPGSYVLVVSDANSCVDGALNTYQFVDPAVLSPNATVTANVSCFGGNNGSATASVTGGGAPYSISWNTVPVQTGANASGLSAGNYTVTVTDARGCARTQNVTITQPAAALNASIAAHTNVYCFGNSTGSATVNVTGGTTNYSYNWNTSPVQSTATATNLDAGTYTCNVTDAKGCTTSASVTIVEPAAALSASISASINVLCFGNATGSATVNVTGGTTNYSYSWNSTPVQTTATAINLSAGNYTCTLTDANGCSTTASVTITQPIAALTASIIAQVNVACGGNTGSATAGASGGTAPFGYSWNTSPVQSTAIATSLGAGSFTCTITDAHGCSTSATATITAPAGSLNASLASQTNVLCFANSTGSATVNIMAGTPPYNISWNTSPVQNTTTASGLAAGNYTCTITDANGCTANVSVTIAQPAAALSASISASTNVLCFGNATGSATVNVAGGTTNYSYSWNSIPVQTTAIAINLVAGNYTCTITDANGCSTTASVTITQPIAALTASIIAQVNVACGGNTGSATAGASGGTAPYSYSWNTSPVQSTATATSLGAGSYTCTITDAHGCSTSATATITAPAGSLNASLASQTNVLCFGNSTGSATVNIMAGTPPYNISWNTSPVQTTATATALAAGSYICTITDANGCTANVSVTIAQPAAALSASISASADVLCFGNATGDATVSVTGGTPNYNYSWNSIPVQSGATATNLSAGNYTCTITDANGCSTTASVTINEPATSLSASIINQVNVACGGTTGSATVGASGGTPLYTYSWNTVPVQTNATASNIGAGTYTCTITDANGCSTNVNATITAPPGSLSASITSTTDVLCFGNNTGSAATNISGGTLPYTISWNTSPAQNSATANNLPAGTWTCTITDNNGCTANVSTVIAQPMVALNANISASSAVDCFGNANGSATVNITGGTPNYGIAWNTSPVQNNATATNLSSGNYTVTITDANGCSANTTVAITQPVAPLAAAISAQTNVACGGNSGSATVNANGGTWPYSYSWNTTPVQTGVSATSLGAGTYTCTITDGAGCSTTVDATITAPPGSLSVSIASQVDVTCSGNATGTATANITGGTLPYSIDWNSSPSQNTATATGLGAGNYMCTVTDNNGCIGTGSATINEPAQAVAVSIVSAQGVTCFGAIDGTATANANGGTGSIGYIWDSSPAQNGATMSGVDAGTYNVTATDANGCSATAQATISAPIANLSVTLVGSTDQSCFGSANGQATVSASGGTGPYSYSWNTSPTQNTATATGLGAGTFTVTVGDAHGCSGTLDVTIGGPNAPLALNIASVTNVLCYQDSTGAASVNAIGGTAPYTYWWNTAPVINGDSLTNATAGVYTAMVTDANGCASSTNVTITQPVIGLFAFVEGYQNESCFGANDGNATLQISGGSGSYTVVWSSAPPQTGPTATGLGAGVYTASISDNNGCDTQKDLPVTILGPNAPLSITSSLGAFGAFNTSCSSSSDGSINASITGGTQGYTSVWNGPNGYTANTEDISGLAAGTYDLFVTDANGCTANSSISLNAPPALQATANITTAACQGSSTGAIDLTISGGTAPYSSAWSGPNAFSANSEDISNLPAGVYTVDITDAHGCPLQQQFDVNQPGLFSISATLSAFNGNGVSCNNSTDGSIDVSESGGTAPYSFLWNGPSSFTANTEDLSGIGAGTYNLTLNDANGCSSLVSYTLTAPNALNISLNASAFNGSGTSCNGSSNGSIDATIIGGTPGFNFAWSGPNGFAANSEDISALIAGDYLINVTDTNDCTASATATITAPTPVNVQVGVSQQNSGDAIACNGGSNGSINLTISGGSGPYSTQWTGPNGFTANTADIGALAAGVYNAIITDANGCTASVSTTLTGPAPIDLTSILSDANGFAIACNGGSTGSIDLTISGGGGNNSVQWSGPNAFASNSEDISALLAGNYVVLVTDQNGCTQDTSITLREPPVIGSSATIATAACQGNADGAINLTTSGGVAPLGFQWFGPGGFTSTNEDLTTLFAGIYTVTITDANGCANTQPYDVNQPGLFTITSTLSSFTGGYNVSCASASNGSIDVEVSGASAPYFYTWTGPNGFSAITQDISNLTAGTYDLTLSDANGCSTLAQYTLVAPSPLNIGLTPSVFPGGYNTDCGTPPTGSIDANIIGGVAPYTIQWNGPGGFTSINEDVTQLGAGDYAINVMDALGCTQSASVTLVGPTPLTTSINTSVINGNGTGCNGASDGSIGLLISGGSLPYNVQWSGPNGYASNNDSISGLSAGTYVATIIDVNGCTANVSVNLSAPSPIDVQLNASTYSGGWNIPCNGGSQGDITANISGGIGSSTYAWSGPNGFTSASANISGLVAGIYTLIATDSIGCTGTASITLTEPTPLNGSTTLSDMGNGYQVSCSNNDGSIDLTPSGGNTPYQFNWNGPNGFASLNEDLSGLSQGDYTITLIDANGCTFNNTITLAAPGVLNATLAVTGNVCDGTDDAAIDLQLNGGVQPYTFVWSGPNGFAASSEDISNLASGDYTVSVTDAGSCSGSWSATIIASSHMDLSAYLSDYGNYNIPCSGDSTGVINVTLIGGQAPLNITWSGPNGFASSATQLSGLLAGNYALHVSDGNGCAMDSSFTLTAPSTPIGAALTAMLFPSGVNVSCNGGNNGSIDATISGGTAPYNINWNGVSGFDASTEDISGLAAGTYDLVITDTNQCSFSTSITLTEPDSALMANVTLSQFNGGFNTSCNGTSDGSISVIALGGNGGNTFSWSGPNGFTSNTNNISNLIAGTYALTVTDTNGCALTQSIDVIAPQPLQPVFDADTFPSGTNISCAGVNDGALNITINGGAPNYNVQWTGPNGFTSTSTSLNTLAAGQYCANITDANNCTAQACFTLTEPQALVVSATPTSASCGQNNGAIDATVTGGSSPFNYAWSNSATTEDISGLAANTYSIVVTDVNGCADSTSVNVIGAPGMNANGVVSAVLCNGDNNGSIDLTVTSGTAPFNFNWSNSASTEDLGGLVADSYSITITDANGCTWSDAFTVDQPLAISADSTLSLYANGHNISAYGAHDGSISIAPQGGTAPYSYAWSTGASTAQINGLAAGTYTVTITDAHGCSITLSFTLDSPDDLQLPNGFTPNGDGNNDAFVIHGLDGYHENQLTVFNRWGNVVYDAFNYKNDWRGENQQGQELPNGTYFAVLSLNNGGITLETYVDLRR